MCAYVCENGCIHIHCRFYDFEEEKDDIVVALPIP